MKHNRPPQIEDSPLAKLEDHGEFVMRHIGPRDEHVQIMLEEIGVSSLDELISTTLPPSIQLDEPLDLPRARNETETIDRLREMASMNRVQHSMIGMGYHDTKLPAVIQRNVLENPGWYTAYTPYQAEISVNPAPDRRSWRYNRPGNQVCNGCHSCGRSGLSV